MIYDQKAFRTYLKLDVSASSNDPWNQIINLIETKVKLIWTMLLMYNEKHHAFISYKGSVADNYTARNHPVLV